MPKTGRKNKLCECGRPRLPRKSLCDICDFQEQLQKSGQKAVRRGDYMGGLAGYGISMLVGLGREMSQNPRHAPPPRQPAPGQNKGCPFVFLGLNRGTATEKDIRERQKKLAEIWHPDTGAGPEAEAKLREVNEAAEMCLQILRNKP